MSLALTENILLRAVGIMTLLVLPCKVGGTGGLGVLVVSTRLTAEFVNGGGVNDIGGSGGSALAAARAKISCVERFVT